MSEREAELEERVRRLEEELAALRQEVRDAAAFAAAAAKAAAEAAATARWESLPFVRESRDEQEEANAAIDQVLAEMGITGEPIGAEKLQEMIRASGTYDPNDNWASRGIIEAREE
jgi:hypothetical protein